MKRHLPNSILKLIVVTISAVSMVGCEVQFTPQITPVDFSTPPPMSEIVTVDPDQTLSPLEATGTADAIDTTFPQATREPLANSAGDPEVASYQEAYCDDPNRICYELCYQNTCGIYNGAHARVEQFIKAVDNREAAIIEWESEERTEVASGVAAFGSCATSLLAAAPAYAVVTAADPEPISKTILIVGGAVVAGVVCGGSLLVRSNSAADQRVDEREIAKQTLIAEQSFGFLNDFVEEVEIDE